MKTKRAFIISSTVSITLIGVLVFTGFLSIPATIIVSVILGIATEKIRDCLC